MRTYDILYNPHNGNGWVVIAKDSTDEYWFVFQDNIKVKSTAMMIANALNQENN